MKNSFLFILLMLASAAGISAQCTSIFYDGFESGAYSPTWSLGGSLTSASVTTTSPAIGSYRLEATGGVIDHLNGLSTSFPAATPGEISWYIYPTGNVATNYFVAGNSGVTATNCIVFCYWFGSSNIIRFVSSSTFEYPATTNQWYYIALRNINWTAHTFDIYINNTLVSTAFPFRSATQNDVSKIHLYNYNNGNAAWDQVVLGAPQVSLLASTQNVACAGDSSGQIDLSITSGTPMYTYAWSNGEVTEDINNLAAGTYSVTVTDNNGCTSQLTSINITEPAGIGLNISATNESCVGLNDGSATVMATGGTPGYSYSWNTGSTSTNLTALAPGIYTCTVTDTLGCDNDFDVEINPATPLLTSLSPSNPTTCLGANGSIIASVSGGTPSYTYLWSNGGIGTAISGLSQGTYALYLTDSLGCQDTAYTFLSDPPLPSVSTNLTTDSLCTSDGILTLTTGLPAGGSWSGTGITGNAFNPATAGLGNHTLTYSYTDTNNCSATANEDLLVSACLGFENDELSSFQLYPNPAQTSIYLQINNTKVTSWEIINTIGQVVLTGNNPLATTFIDINGWAPGMYTVSIHTVDGKYSKRFIKQ